VSSNSNPSRQKEVSLPTVGVLLATHNGSPWLNDQLDSIFNQEGVDLRLYVLDDFSKDDTVTKLREWKDKGFPITLLSNPSKRLGLPGAFYYMMKLPYQEQFIALADQDDVWKNNHLAESVKSLGSNEVAIAFSKREYMNSVGVVTGVSRNISRPPSTSNAMIENIAYGNTIVMTNQLLKKASLTTPESSVMHDSWLYLWASVFGVTVYHENIGVRYRLHKKNFIGVHPHLRWIQAISRMKKFIQQDIEFLEAFRSIEDSKLQIIEEFLNVIKSKNPFKRLCYCLSSKCYRQGKVDDFLLKCLIVMMPRFLYKNSRIVLR
jgi:glycosyltransferase involved in cell wall biosynthesis